MPGEKNRSSALAMLIALAALSGCVTAPPQPELEPEPAPPPVAAEPAPEIPIVDPAPEPATPDTPVEPPTVAVVLTSRSPAYEDVANALVDHFGSMSIYDLSDRSQPPVNAFRLINDSTSDVVVAIGLRAARSSVAMSQVPVVFSQVFNHQDHALLGERSRGVAAVAPMHAQLGAWKEVEPALSSVGLIIGPGHDALLQEAELAAQMHGVQLTISVANSDQEALYYFRRMVREIDGFWLLPDNRVLSNRSLRDMLQQADRHNVSVLVPNRNMLSLGAAISVSAVATDIAARIRDIIQHITQGQLDVVPPITALTEIRVETNDALLNRRSVAAGAGGYNE